MPRALWNNQIIAETENFESVDGNVYFPPGTVKADKLEPSGHTSFCPWKGTASYYDVVVDGERNKNAAWYYPEPKEKALNIKDHIAFWKGVTVEK
ncbi:MAG: DUF427 domain-containing protein [Rhodospirillaceae bacterium]|nr:DUF427 domain-containing protein [Rhodospirillaceae bacterium]